MVDGTCAGVTEEFRIADMGQVFNFIRNREEHNLGKNLTILFLMLDMTRIHKRVLFWAPCWVRQA